ncbi:MAG: hypothetical protein ACRDQ2_18590 [Gaiellales bacterium]
MRTISKVLAAAVLTAVTVLPAAPAVAETNPCKGSAPGPHCRPPCFYEVIVHPGDPAAGEAPWIEIRETFC